MPSDADFPSYDEGQVYLLSGGELNGIVALIKRSRPRVGEDSGLAVDQEDEDGTWLSVDGGDETVTGAVNGVPSTLVVKTDGNGWTAI